MIADQIKKFRQAKQLSQIDLAKASGIHHVTISVWERGETDGMKVTSVEKLAKALGVTPNDLLGVGTVEKEESK